jgi:hypothetical protein
MNARLLKKPRGRRPKWRSGLPRRPGCRDCPLSKRPGGCRTTGLWSGRCGDYVWFVRRGKQYRRLWVEPNDPRTPRQRRHRARLSATSAAYSGKLTDEQQDACIAAGTKRRCRPRLGDSGPHTGLQYWVHTKLKGKPDLKGKKAPGRTQVLHSQRVTKKYKSQVSQPQAHPRTTWEPPRIHTGMTPGQRRQHAGQGRKGEGGRTHAEGRRQTVVTSAEVPQNRRLKPAARWPGRASVIASPRFPRPLTSHGSRRRSFSRRRHRGRGVVRFVQHSATNAMFGTFIKELRTRRQLSLREFCLEHGHSPGNWSRIEREVLPPPHDERTLRAWARQLRLQPGSDDWFRFFDYAAVAAGRIPDHILQDKALAAQLPAIFRALSGQKPSREDKDKLLAPVKSTRRS